MSVPNLVSIRPESRAGLTNGAFRFSPPEGVSYPPTLRRELADLSQESDSQLYAEGLLAVARRAEQANRLELALPIYQAVESSAGAEHAQRARESRAAMLGQGAFGARAEFLLRSVAEEAADPGTLLAMGAAGAVFRLTRAATLARLAGAVQPGFLTRLLGAGRLASLSGLALEAPTFTFLNRVTHQALGRPQDWSSPSLARDLASSYLLLGGLRFTGAMGELAATRLTPSPLLRGVFKQGSTLAGLLLTHRLETSLGLRARQEGATVLADSLAMLLQFHVSGRLSSEFFPAAATQERALQTLAQAARRPALSESLSYFPAPQVSLAGASARVPSASLEPGENKMLGPQILAMAAHNPYAGGGGGGGRLSIGHRVAEHLRKLSSEPHPEATVPSTGAAIEFRFEGVTLAPDSGARNAFFRDTLNLLLDQQESGYPFSLRGELSQALRSNGALRAAVPALRAAPGQRWIADIRAEGHELTRLALFEEVSGQWRPRRLLLGTQISRYDESQDPAVYDLDFSQAHLGRVSGKIYRPNLDGRWEADPYWNKTFETEASGIAAAMRWSLYPKSSYALTVHGTPGSEPSLRIQDYTGFDLFSVGAELAPESQTKRRGS